jgi:type IX secretion system PorP/SprF family membrane protein
MVGIPAGSAEEYTTSIALILNNIDLAKLYQIIHFVHALSFMMCAACFYTPCAAQINLQMSQYMFNGMVVNPAHTGEHEALNIQAMMRMQWIDVAGAPSTQIVTLDAPIFNYNSGIGLSLMRETIGAMDKWSGLGNLGIYANYAFRMKVNDLGDRVIFGLSAGFVQNTYDAYNPAATNGFGVNQYDDVYDEILANKKPDRRADFKAGIMYEMGDVFYAGISAVNLGSFLPLPSHDSLVVQTSIAMLHGGGNIPIGDMFALRPTILYMQPLARSRKNMLLSAATLDIGMAAVIAQRFWLGIACRTTLYGGISMNSVTFLAQAWLTKNIRLGYSYDLPMSGISAALGGSHEVSLGFTMDRKTALYKNARDF